MANLESPDLRLIYDAYQQGNTNLIAQERLTSHRKILLNYAPFPPTIKAFLAHLHNFPHWAVRPPLLPMSKESVQQALSEWSQIG